MILPLYNPENAPASREQWANVGLWYDKFCSQWQPNWTLGTKGKRDWIKTVTESNPVGNTELIRGFKERQLHLVAKLNGKTLFFQTDGRLVTGIGREHPVENGFSWHYTLGVPYLPGSSVKGIMRSWAEVWLADERVSRIFGPEGNANREVGSVIFFDALPIKPIKLDLDIMTPHYSEYYRAKEQPPADWYSPIPIPFLTVASEQPFVFNIAPRRHQNVQDIEDVNTVANWLADALSYIGAGAKTATGYGRFVPDAKEQKAWQKQFDEEISTKEKHKKMASMSQVQKEMELDGYSQTINQFMGAINSKWLNRMETADAQESVEIAELLIKWYQEKNPKQWEKPNDKNTVKINRIKAVLSKRP